MKCDFFAEYAWRWQGHTKLDQFTQVQLLAGALVSDKTQAQQILKNWILTKALDGYLQRQWQEFTAALDPSPEVSLNALPACSFAIQFAFKLRKPYLSKDEQDFYILDNPVRKDKVFKLPYVAPSSWKGSLRSALRLERKLPNEESEKKDPIMIRLFGPVKGEEDEEAFRQGRLHFFPTFFTQVNLEVINPHDRKTGAGKNPIFIESVPIEAQGTFTLLYVPFDRIGQYESKTRSEVAEDLRAVAEGIKAMFTQYGFGAKTGSGFGVADIESGTLTLRVEEAASLVATQPSKPTADLPRYLEASGRLKPEYLTCEGAFRERAQTELKAMSKADRQLYEKAMKWWESQRKEAKASPPEQKPEPEPPQPRWWQREFKDALGLDHMVEEACRALQGESRS